MTLPNWIQIDTNTLIQNDLLETTKDTKNTKEEEAFRSHGERPIRPSSESV